jgi:hypothetical protein
MSLPYTFSTLNLTTYPKDAQGNYILPASALDENFTYVLDRLWVNTTAPTDTDKYPFWLDTSVNPNLFKLWNGSQWVTLNLAAGSSGYIQFNKDGTLAGDSNLFWDNTNKRLGIGTMAPAGKLDVSPGGTVTAGDLVVDTENKMVYVGRLSGTIGDQTQFIVRNRLGNTMFSVNPTTGYGYFSGDVGIGTTTPAEKLDVNGNIASTGSAGTVETGTISNTGWQTVAVTFPVAFNSVPHVVVTHDNSGTGDVVLNLRIRKNSLTTTGFTIDFDVLSVGISGTTKFHWIAIQ